MELNIRKFNDAIVRNCQIIEQCHDELSDLLRDYQYGTRNRPKIDRALVRMSIASTQVLDLVAPLPSAGQIHGLRREVTLSGGEPDVLIVDKDNPKWDFRPWFIEKATVMSDSLNKLMEYLETNPADIEFAPDAGVASLEFVQSMIRSSLAEIEGMAQTLLDMISSGRITVVDVKLEEEGED